MNSRKRGTKPDEAPDQANKRPRVQKKVQIPDPVPPPNQQEANVVDSGRPGSPSNRVSQAGSPHTPPVQLPPEQIDRRVGRPILKLNPPKTPTELSPSRAGPTDPGSSRSETSTCYSQDVANYDVEPGVDPIGRIQDKDLKNWGSVDGAAAFIRSSSGLEGNWVGIRPLGKGGNGIAGLWEWRDENGQPTKQMVVKEETYTRTQWKSSESVQKVPSEVKTMSKLNKTKCYAIPRLFNYKRYPNHTRHRMYMEYCPFKDLSVLCNRYRGFRHFLPEPFLWDTFYHLVEAAVAMRDGPKKHEWGFEIVHRDLKPHNIFLGSENEEKGFPFYPVAKTGDFGLAVMTNKEDPANPREYQDAGTEGYYASEQFRNDDPTEQQAILSSHTNVWGIGATMFELLTLYSHADYMNDPDFNNNGYVIDIQTVKNPEYSQDIRELIQDCLRPEPRNRIRLDVLRICIKAYRDRIQDTYKQSNENEQARFKSESRLYYNKSEINNMSPGNWSPFDKKKKPVREQFPEKPGIRYPRFANGPEVEKEESDDSDGGGDNNKARAPRGRQAKITVHPPKRRRRGRRMVVIDDTTNKHTDNNAIPQHKSARKVPHSQLGRGDATHETPKSGGAGAAGASDKSLRDGGNLVKESRLDERLQGSLADGILDDGTDDGSYSMEEDSDDPVSPLPLPALQAPAPAAQPAARKLRNGRVVAYF